MIRAWVDQSRLYGKKEQIHLPTCLLETCTLSTCTLSTRNFVSDEQRFESESYLPKPGWGV